MTQLKVSSGFDHSSQKKEIKVDAETSQIVLNLLK